MPAEMTTPVLVCPVADAWPVPWHCSHWMPRPGVETLASVMKSSTVLLSSRAH